MTALLDLLIEQLQRQAEIHGGDKEVKMTGTWLPEGFYKDKELEEHLGDDRMSDVFESTVETIRVHTDKKKVPYIKLYWQC